MDENNLATKTCSPRLTKHLSRILWCAVTSFVM